MTGPADLPQSLLSPRTRRLIHTGTRESADDIHGALQGTYGMQLINITDPTCHPQHLVRIAYRRTDTGLTTGRLRFISPGDAVEIDDLGQARVMQSSQIEAEQIREIELTIELIHEHADRQHARGDLLNTSTRLALELTRRIELLLAQTSAATSTTAPDPKDPQRTA